MNEAKDFYNLSNDKQIVILNELLGTIQENVWTGLCFLCAKTIESTFKIKCVHYYDIPQIIKGFSRENAIKLHRKYKFKKPNKLKPYWWEINNREVRISFIKALISELENNE